MLYAFNSKPNFLTPNQVVRELTIISIATLPALATAPAYAETGFELQALIANHEQSRSAQLGLEAALSDSLTVSATVGRERPDDSNDGSARNVGMGVEWYGLTISEAVQAGISMELGQQQVTGGNDGTVNTPSRMIMAIARWAPRPALELSLGAGVSRERADGKWSRQTETSFELEYAFENDTTVKLMAGKSGNSDPVVAFETTVPTAGPWSFVVGVEQQASDTTVHAGLSFQY